jgi:hypothetical protein
MKFGEIKADYYDYILSYYKLVMQKVEIKGSLKQVIVKEIFNGILNCLDKDSLEIKLKEIFYSTALLENKLIQMNNDERKIVVKELYDNYILPMIYSYQNGDLDLVKMLFVYMHDKIMEISGYYGIFGENYINDNFMVAQSSK